MHRIFQKREGNLPLKGGKDGPVQHAMKTYGEWKKSSTYS
jgi:hypothetical protein